MGTIYLNDIKYGGGSGGSSKERELTKAEYEALSEEEKMNGTTYFITDGQGGGSAGGFSLAEILPFGEYTELATYNFTQSVKSDDKLLVIYDNGDEIESPTEALQSMIIFANNKKWLGSSYGRRFVFFSCSTEGITIIDRSNDDGGSYGIPRLRAVYKIESKSGGDSISPEKYTLSEQKIGTWIDKPLYRQTFHTIAPLSPIWTTWDDLTNQISEAGITPEAVIDMKGIVYGQDGVTHTSAVMGKTLDDGYATFKGLLYGSLFRGQVGSYFVGGDVYITIEYIKD